MPVSIDAIFIPASPSLVNRLELVTVGIEHEGGVISRAVVWPRSRRAAIATAGPQRRGMEHVHSATARRREGEMKAGPGRPGPLGQGEQSQFISAAFLAEPDPAQV